MILAVLQARVSSSRLPGKVLKPILGVPMILRQIERIRRSKRIDDLVVATSSDASDDPLDKACCEAQVQVFRGSLNDVLDRFYRATENRRPEYVVRLTGDCPLADPAVIDDVVSFCLNGGFDFASNALHPTFPDGLDVEVMRWRCLEIAWKSAVAPSDREHVTPFLYKNPSMFRIGDFRAPTNLSEHRWTVDEQADFDVVSAIYENLYPANKLFAMDDVLRFLEARPELMNANRHIKRNEGYVKSQMADRSARGRVSGRGADSNG